MIKTLRLFGLFIILTLTACSTNKIDESHTRFASIDLNPKNNFDKVEPLISPSDYSENGSNDKTGKVKNVVGLVFGPGVNRTIGYIPLLKHFDKNKFSYHVISGSGMGALFAAYMAMGKSHNIIEWDFYQLFRKLEGVIPYSSEWLEIVDGEILKKFQGVKIQSLQKLLVIPLYDLENNELKYFYQGDLYLALKYNFTFVPKEKGQRFVSALKGSPFEVAKLEEFGVDSWIGFDSLGDRLTFDKIGDDYLVGVFGKQISLKSGERTFYKKFYILPTSQMPLDAVKTVPRYLKESDKQAEKITKELIDNLEDDYGRE